MANPARSSTRKTTGGSRNNPYLTPAFYFTVEFLGSKSSSPKDSSFLEVSGLSPEIETESVVEGGENRFTYQLPKQVKYPKLVLKRGILDMNSPLVRWCRKTFEGGYIENIEPADLSIRLLDQKGDPARAWDIVSAFPTKWDVEAFNSTKNDVAIEKIELSYNLLVRTK